MSRRLVALALVAVAAIACKKTSTPTAPEESLGPDDVPFTRTAIIGASFSAGMASGPISHILEGRLIGPHDVLSVASIWTFKAPQKNLREQLAQALRFEPTVIMALDAVFWCAYGSGAASSRERRLRACLGELESVSVPVFLGDIPNMAGAAEWLLPSHAIPPPGELERQNALVREWAATRANVRVVPFGAWSKQLQSRDPETEGLMSPDNLHPNRDGAVYVLRRMAREVPGAGALKRI